MCVDLHAEHVKFDHLLLFRTKFASPSQPLQGSQRLAMSGPGFGMAGNVLSNPVFDMSEYAMLLEGRAREPKAKPKQKSGPSAASVPTSSAPSGPFLKLCIPQCTLLILMILAIIYYLLKLLF